MTPDKRYVFSYWASGVSDPLRGGSSLILRINGSASERSYAPLSNWGKLDFIWPSGNATSATLETVSAKEPKDHIFGLSDISLVKL